MWNGIVFAIVHAINKKKYTKFVISNSEALYKIDIVNRRYSFYEEKCYSYYNSYDNVNFYNSISPKDYLTYQLVYDSYKVYKCINNIKDNAEKYAIYKNEINNIELGKFKSDIGKLKLNKLKRFELKLFKNKLLSPQIEFYAKVTLSLTNIKGNYKSSKSKKFNESEVVELIRKVRMKRGDRFLDQDVWNSIVNVERGKVSNRLRFAIYKRDHNRCCKCGSRRNLEIDHIVPIAKGGKTTYDNLQTLCHRCNVKKGTETIRY